MAGLTGTRRKPRGGAIGTQIASAGAAAAQARETLLELARAEEEVRHKQGVSSRADMLAYRYYVAEATAMAAQMADHLELLKSMRQDAQDMTEDMTDDLSPPATQPAGRSQ